MKPVVCFYVQASSFGSCRAWAIHHSGKRPLDLTAGDGLAANEGGDVGAGVIHEVVAPEPLPEGYWLYRITYAPERGEHRIGAKLFYFGQYALSVVDNLYKNESTGSLADGAGAQSLAATA